MTNEEKQQLKARFFGQYIGCKCNNGGNLASVSFDKKLYWLTTVYENGATYSDYDLRLILRPLSSITDEEAIECAKIYNDEGDWVFYQRTAYFAQVVDKESSEMFTIWFPEDDTSIITLVDTLDNTCAFNQFNCIDWLRSRNFCLPFCGLDPIQEGWAVLETDNQLQP